MIAVVSTTSTEVAPVADHAATGLPGGSPVLVGHDVARERELDLMAASIETSAEGLAVFLLLAVFGVASVLAMPTGVLA